MKLRKLNARGASHIIALMGVIVLTGIIGSYLLLRSHADSCTSGISDPISSPTSDPGSCGNPVSDPTTPVPIGPKLSCEIDGVPAEPAYNTKLQPTVTITNQGDQAATNLVIDEGFGIGNNVGNGQSSSQPLTIASLAAGASQTLTLRQYTVPYASDAFINGGYDVEAKNYPFDCSSKFVLPVQPLSYKATCTVNPIADVRSDSKVAPSVTIKNTGTGPITPQFSYYYLALESARQSSVKVATMGTIAAGRSASIKLPAYVVNASFSEAYRFTVTSKTKGVSFSCSDTFVVAVPSIKSVTINPNDWQDLDNAVVTKDGSHGSVVRIHQSVKYEAGIYAKHSPTGKGIYPNGNPLGKLKSFAEADLGKKATVCAVARANQTENAYVSLAVNSFASYNLSTKNPNLEGSFREKDFKLTKSYSKNCFNFTIASKADYLKYDVYDGPDIWVQNSSYGTDIYIDSVTLTLE